MYKYEVLNQDILILKGDDVTESNILVRVLDRPDDPPARF
jgi:hypothetical protein